MKGIGFTLGLLAATSGYACDVSPGDLLKRIQNGGAETVVKDVWPTADCESVILGHVASGSHVWISAGLSLYGHTDASYSEGIHDSLGRAMQVAPSRVLPLVNTEKHRASQICLPWMLDDSGESDRHYKSITRRARAMFESFLDTSYRQQAEACLTVVANAEAGLQKGRGQ
jgi:hypothetical protein